MIIGTANYMSPEQAKGKVVDARTDIFSFGVLLYEMIAGNLPFAGENALEMIGAILHKEAKPLSTNIPTEITKIISKCLRKDSDERYQTIKDVGIELKDVKHELELKNLMERSIVPKQDENKTQILKAPTLDEIHQTTTNQAVASNSAKKYLAIALAVLIISTIGFVVYKYLSPVKQIESIAVDSPKIALKLYWQMTEAEQLIFIRERARYIQTLIGDEATEFDEEELRTIKAEIDHYVERKDSLAQKPFEEGMRVIYGRASQYAPLVIRVYESRQVPPALGLYQAMIESEYHDCLMAETGSVGLFQFTPKTAAIYGLKPKDYCDVEKQSDAAARLMSDLTSDFGDGKSSATLGLLGFVIGGDKPRDYLRQLRVRGITERNFWAIFRYQENLQPPLSEEGKRYVPQFFATAIIGETPEAFELSTPPLSTLREKGK